MPQTDGWGVSGWGGTLTSGGGGGGGGGSITVSNFAPGDGTPITPSTPLAFDVTSTSTIRTLVISVLYPQTGAREIVYNRDGFSANYLPNGAFQGSERATIAGGYHFTLRRRGGWYLSPQVTVEGGDSNGNAIAQ